MKSLKYWSGVHNKYYNREKILRLKTDNGYLKVQLCKDGKGKMFSIHRLVAEAFIENLDQKNKTQVNHINNLRNDNRVNNLEWVSAKENMQHATKQGRMHYKPENLKKAQQSRKKAVIAIKGNETLYFESAMATEKYGFNHRNVASCCKKRYGCRTHKGYIWRYKEDN